MRPYSRILLWRAIAGALVFSALIGFAMYWQRTQVTQPDQAVYRPAQRIVQVLAADQALRQSATPDSVASPTALPCEGRSLEVLRARLVASGVVSPDQVNQRIRSAAASPQPWPNCAPIGKACATAPPCPGARRWIPAAWPACGTASVSGLRAGDGAGGEAMRGGIMRRGMRAGVRQGQ